jgi:Cdc6-like AAA superfamily ATPase
MDSTLSIASDSTEVDDAPTPVDESIPMRSKNAYKHLKSFLRLSSTTAKSSSADVIGREDEKAILRSYFSLRSAYDVGLYVSGPPGTGKTALITAMGREMAREGWSVVEVGCMGVKTGDIWAQLAEQLGCDRTENAVQTAIAEIGKNTYVLIWPVCMPQLTNSSLIVLDEVDSLLPPAPALPTPATSHLLSRLFSLPLLSTSSSTIKFIAISNTLDLTVRARLVLPEGTQPQVLPFKAYGTTEMVDIINSRIASAALGRLESETVKVDGKAIELLTRKVEAQNGDLRMCLASLTSAVNLAEAEWVKKTFTSELDQPDCVVPLVKIALPHIIKAFTSHTQQLRAAAGSSSSASGSPTSRKIRSGRD